MTTQTAKVPATLNSLIDRPDIKARFEKLIGKDKSGVFLTSVMQVVSSNELLKKADPMSILNGAVTAATLDLPLNNQLGLAYLVPFNVKQADGSKKVMAQFIIGYRGLINLAERTGSYKTISATPIYEGQLIEENPLTGYKFDFKKKSNKLIGYAAYFKLKSGFEKTIYWTLDEVLNHAKKHSKTYGKSDSTWNTDQPEMCKKTLIRHLIGKYGPVSVDYQRAEAVDEEIYSDLSTEPAEYKDPIYVPTESEREKLEKLVNENLADNTKTAEDLTILIMQIDPGQYQDLIDKIQSKIETMQKEKGGKK